MQGPGWRQVWAERDTPLRLPRGPPLHANYTPRVLGVDDWSLHKGQTLGTILVDSERHWVVHLLLDDVADQIRRTMVGWFTRHLAS